MHYQYWVIIIVLPRSQSMIHSLVHISDQSLMCLFMGTKPFNSTIIFILLLFGRDFGSTRYSGTSIIIELPNPLMEANYILVIFLYWNVDTHVEASKIVSSLLLFSIVVSSIYIKYKNSIDMTLLFVIFFFLTNLFNFNIS